ncbi:MAG: radical SAM protein [Bacteroidota bacterium]
MATFLFNEIIFGPVNSRRLGVSLGVNLLPQHCKFCNFNCVYCECGWTDNKQLINNELPDRDLIRAELENRLSNAKKNDEHIDVITFAGNGEPTIHPDFPEIIDDTIALRNRYLPNARIAVLSNATMLHASKIKNALEKIEFNILKLDSAKEETIQLLNKPLKKIHLPALIEQLKSFSNLTIQTLFVKGIVDGIPVDNSSEEELESWIALLKHLQPKLIMIYTIARDTPLDTLEAIPVEKLHKIADRLKKENFDVSVSG